MSAKEQATDTGEAGEGTGVSATAWLMRRRTGWDALVGTLEVIGDRIRFKTAAPTSEKMARWLVEVTGDTALAERAQQEAGVAVLDVHRGEARAAPYRLLLGGGVRVIVDDRVWRFYFHDPSRSGSVLALYGYARAGKKAKPVKDALMR